MGTIKSGILGGFNGKIGSGIGASWKGISYMRGIAQTIKNPKTEAQVMQRNFFTEISALTAQHSEDQLRTFFPKPVSGKTHRNLLFKQLAEACSVDESGKHFDASLLTTLGNASTIDFGDVSVLTLINGDNLEALKVSFNADKTADVFDNYGAFIVIDATKGSIHCFNSTQKMNAELHEIPTQHDWEENDKFVVIPFLYESHIAIHGFGTMAVSERPPKKR